MPLLLAMVLLSVGHGFVVGSEIGPGFSPDIQGQKIGF
jgi:hypothetical protein